MTSVKIFSSDWWDGLPAGDNQIKVAAGGLGSNDRRDAEKFASAEFMHWLDSKPLEPDCFYVHKVAMGGSHRYGPNRWGDGFREEVLERDVKTFESAKAYRQHLSDAPYYGQVKLARLRPAEGFVDLVTEYFGTDRVAQKYGGLMADEEIESLAKHGHIPVSMGSLVPGDVCSICEHFAPKPKDRCSSKAEGGKCTLFGCKTGMLQMSPDGRMNYVDNPVNRFYDISKVRVGADPIANGLLLPIGDFNIKRAEMTKLAEFVLDSVDLDQVSLNRQERTALDLAYYWSDLEPKSADFQPDDFDPGYVSHRAAVPEGCGIHRQDAQLRRDAMRRLIRDDCLPDFESFAKSAGADEQTIEAARSFLPNLYTRLICNHRLVATIKRASISIIRDENLRSTFATPSSAGIDLTSVTRRSLLLNANRTELSPRKMASIGERLPQIVADYAAMKLAYFAADDKVNTAVLRGVVRRDMFDLNIRA